MRDYSDPSHVSGLFIGKGRLGRFFFQRPESQNWMSLTQNSPATFQRDCRDARNLKDLPTVQNIIFALSPRERTEEAYREIYIQSLKNVLLSCDFQRIVFCSATSVYAEKNGDWVNEGSKLEEESFRGRILIEAEALIAEYAKNYVILRFSGLCNSYDDYDSAKPTSSWRNVITRDKAAEWLERAVRYPDVLKEIFNISERIYAPLDPQNSSGKRVCCSKAENFFKGII